MTDGKSGEQRATQRKRDRREVERTVHDGTETGRAGRRASNARRNGTVGKERAGNEVGKNYVSRPQQNSTKQPSSNSRTNLSHTLGRRREATARQSNRVHYGAITTNLTTK